LKGMGRQRKEAGSVKDWQELRRVLQPHRRAVIGLSLLAVAATIAEIAVITIISALAGRAISGTDSLSLFNGVDTSHIVLLGVVALVSKVLLDVLNARTYAHSLYEVETRLRTEIAELQAVAPWATIEDSSTGSIQSVLWTSVARTRDGFGQAMTVVTNLSSLVLMLGATLLTGGLLVIPVILGLLIFGMAFRPLIRAVRDKSEFLRNAYKEYNHELNESIAMSREARVLGIQDILASRLARAGESTAKAGAQQVLYGQILSRGYTDLLYAAIVIALAVISRSDTVDSAPLAAVVLLLYRSLTYGQGLQSSLQSIALSGPFMVDVHEWIDNLSLNIESKSASTPIEHFNTVEFRHVGMTYPNGHVGLEGISTSIRRGESVALVGPSGSGKSTLVSLLLALRDQTEGDVLVNGLSLGSMDRRSWRQHLALVPQDNLLFDTTIEENVRCWRDVDHDRVVRALKQANIFDEVEAMTDGLDTTVGEGGRRLSGGQRQRICLARALAGDPSLLVLDEPTSALDPASEQAVKASLERIKGQVSLLIIAHRMTTITICDRVLVMGKGHLLHDGPREQVARESQFFAHALVAADEGP